MILEGSFKASINMEFCGLTLNHDTYHAYTAVLEDMMHMRLIMVLTPGDDSGMPDLRPTCLPTAHIQDHTHAFMVTVCNGIRKVAYA